MRIAERGISFTNYCHVNEKVERDKLGDDMTVSFRTQVLVSNTAALGDLFPRLIGT